MQGQRYFFMLRNLPPFGSFFPFIMALKNGHSDFSIMDIRQKGFNVSLVDEICRKLNPGKGQERRMPTLLLYDEKGLQLFEDITYLEEYYVTNAEIEVLTTHAEAIARLIEPGSQVIELGSGNLRKVSILLDSFENAKKDVEYYALDLSRPELERTLSAVDGVYKHVRCHGLFGTYDDGLAWLKKTASLGKSKCILWLGSSVGNLNRTEAADFLRGFSDVLQGQDSMLIGIDACQETDKVYHAYNDKQGKTHEFILNGLIHANKLMGKEAFRKEDWRVVGEYDEEAGRHQAFYSPVRDVMVEGTLIEAGEKIRVEESHKYSILQSNELWQRAGLMVQARFGNRINEYHLHLVSRPIFSFPLKVDEYAAHPVPSLHEYEQLWAAWDVVTRCMIPEKELLSKPIKLRNCCLFYLGHIPTFLDIHLTRATGDAATKPSYNHIFERGIDPDVDNPENCHAHSEIPDEWPPVAEMLDFQEHVRNRTRSLFHVQSLEANRKLGRAMWIAFEHEAMHLETLLYMLLQSDRTLSPPGVAPDFVALGEQARKSAVFNQWIPVPASTISVGLEDPENDDGPDRYFGWDNEKPRRLVDVPAFEAQARPLTNEDYARYLYHTGQEAVPTSWVSERSSHSAPGDQRESFVNGHSSYQNGLGPPLTDAYLSGKSIKTVYGPIALEHALDWPVFASYDELSGCATWMNGRIPSAEEVRSIYNYVDRNKNKKTDSINTKKVSAVNGHLSNDGIEISPPPHHLRNGASGAEKSPDSHQLFADLEGCNVGFKHFHPMSVTQNGNQLSGQGHMGGVWEWTSSALERHEGFKPMTLYPAYTDDFFDGKHNVVLGGSWATHPRIAGRKTFVNWYQRNYPYAWCGARLVRDIQ